MLTVSRIDAEYAAHPLGEWLDQLKEKSNLKTVGEVTIRISSGHTPYLHDVSVGDVGFVTVECIGPLQFHKEKLKRVTAAQYDNEYSKRPIKSGTVICTIKRRICQAFPWFSEPSNPLAFNQDVALLLPKSEIRASYLAAYLSSRIGQAFADRQKTEQMNPYISLDNLRSLPFVCVGDQVQAKIDELLRRAYSIQENAHSSMAHAELLLENALGLANVSPPEALSYFQSLGALIDANRFDAEYFDPIHLFAEEVICKGRFDHLRDLSQFIATGPAWPSSAFVGPGAPNSKPFVRIRNCKPGTVETQKLGRLDNEAIENIGVNAARAGDLVVGMDGLRWFYAGVLDDEAYINQRVGWVRLNKGDLSPEFVQLVINSRVGQAQLLRRMTIAQTVGHITLDDIKSIKVPRLRREDRVAITNALMKSRRADNLGKHLLESTKKAVEIAIEDSEKAALRFLKDVEFDAAAN